MDPIKAGPSVRNPQSEIRNRKRVSVALIEQSGKILVARRKEGAFLGNYWELPGGGMQDGESPEECVVREVREETGLDVRPEAHVGVFDHDYPELTVEIHAYFCRPLGGEARALASAEIAWIGWEEIPKYRFPAANEKIFAAALRLKPRPQ
jgi:mutator protein MutT